MNTEQYCKIIGTMRRQFSEPGLDDNEFLMFMMYHVYKGGEKTIEEFMINWLIWHNYFSSY